MSMISFTAQDGSDDFKWNKDVLDNFKEDLLGILMTELKDSVVHNVLPSLGPKNFEGEAIEYLRQQNLPITDKNIKDCANAILADLMKNIDDLIVYDEDSQTLEISPFIDAMEFGDFYRPVLKIITRAAEQAFEQQ